MKQETQMSEQQTYRYALVNRPAMLGTIPRGLSFQVEARPAKGEAHHEVARHGILVTERALSDEELEAFELAVLIDAAKADVMAAAVAAELQEYATGYLLMARNDPADFTAAVLQAAHRATQVRQNVQVSIGDTAALVALVVARLMARA
jgi:hypothetical protein